MNATSRSNVVRPVNGRVAAGVCSGLARRAGLDPWLARAAFILFFVINAAAAVLAYALAWVLIPEQAPGDPLPAKGRIEGATLVGLGLILLGGAIFVDRTLPQISEMLRTYAAPLALIVLGALVFLRQRPFIRK